MRRRTIFFPPAHKWLADIISVRSIPEARRSVATLSRIHARSTRSRRRLIKRAIVLAANRAEAMAKKEDLSPKERVELKEISRIYRRAAMRMVV